MSEYAIIDPQIRAWADRHRLKLFTSQAGREIRCAYVSSAVGECFQISIKRPAGDFVSIHAAGIEGRKENDPPVTWSAPLAGLGETLEKVFETVIGWMAPSSRHYPSENG